MQALVLLEIHAWLAYFLAVQLVARGSSMVKFCC